MLFFLNYSQPNFMENVWTTQHLMPCKQSIKRERTQFRQLGNCHLFERHFVCSQQWISVSLLCSFFSSPSSAFAFLFSSPFFPFSLSFSFCGTYRWRRYNWFYRCSSGWQWAYRSSRLNLNKYLYGGGWEEVKQQRDCRSHIHTHSERHGWACGLSRSPSPNSLPRVLSPMSPLPSLRSSKSSSPSSEATE